MCSQTYFTRHLSYLEPSSSPQVSVMASRRALKAVLIDLSGTLHIEDTAVPGAQEALNRWETTAERHTPGSEPADFL